MDVPRVINLLVAIHLTCDTDVSLCLIEQCKKRILQSILHQRNDEKFHQFCFQRVSSVYGGKKKNVSRIVCEFDYICCGSVAGSFSSEKKTVILIVQYLYLDDWWRASFVWSNHNKEIGHISKTHYFSCKCKLLSNVNLISEISISIILTWWWSMTETLFGSQFFF